MATRKPTAKRILASAGLGIRGTIRAYRDESSLLTQKLVIQGTAPELTHTRDPSGKPVQIRRHIVPHDPKTSTQLAQRDKMRQAVAAWHAADSAARASAKTTARTKNITLYMAFVSDYMHNL